MRAAAKAAQVASIGYTSATHDLDATAATELRKSTSGWREDQERAPGFATRACYSCSSTFHLTCECPWTIKIGTRNQNTFVVLIICVYLRSGFERRHQEEFVWEFYFGRGTWTLEKPAAIENMCALLGSGYRALYLCEEDASLRYRVKQVYIRNYGTSGLTRLCQRSYQWSVLRIN